MQGERTKSASCCALTASGMCTGRFGSYGAYKWHVYWKVWIVHMVLTSGMCTGRFGSYGAYK